VSAGIFRAGGYPMLVTSLSIAIEIAVSLVLTEKVTIFLGLSSRMVYKNKHAQVHIAANEFW
jgi:hypothetical protein